MIVNGSAAAYAYRIPPYLRPAIYAHANECYPHECCGLILSDGENGLHRYLRVENIAPEDKREDMFTLDPAPYIEATEAGTLVAIVHSHTKGQTAPSKTDMENQLVTGVPWVIVVMVGPDAIIDEFSFPLPKDAPVTGVDFRPGVADCVELLGRYFHQEFGEVVKGYPRDDMWWHKEAGSDTDTDLFLDHYVEEGFRRLAPHEIFEDPDNPRSRLLLQKGDVGLVKVMSPNRINHCVVYTGGQMMMHHLLNRVSEEAPLSRWLPRIEIWLRHKSQEASVEHDPLLRPVEGDAGGQDPA